MRKVLPQIIFPPQRKGFAAKEGGEGECPCAIEIQEYRRKGGGKRGKVVGGQ